MLLNNRSSENFVLSMNCSSPNSVALFELFLLEKVVLYDFSPCVCVLIDRFNHELVFGISVKNLSKAERLIYGDSLMTHAMILTAVTDKVFLFNYSGQVCELIVNLHKQIVRI